MIVGIGTDPDRNRADTEDGGEKEPPEPDFFRRGTGMPQV